ncbi:MAG: Hsp70 family protein, partial [Oscillatoriales cyanobacterium SM2_3_0]|nr:Hsp70 family protein [Oscillatoriales cyanobacterium SM2_3_0]
GAAIQAGVLGEKSRISCCSISRPIPGVRDVGGVFTKIIERNTTIPTSRSQMFSTAVDGQTSVEIHVLQGERALVKDNKSLGRFLLTGIPPAKRGVPQIEVAFDIDANGILKVSAIDLGTTREQSIQITNTGGLSESEVERMRQEADLYSDEDEQRRQIVELKNQSVTLFENCKVTLKQNAQFVTEEMKTRVKREATALKQALANSDLTYEELKEQVDTFQEMLYDLGAEVYEQANLAGQSATTPAASSAGIASPPISAPPEDLVESEEMIDLVEEEVDQDMFDQAQLDQAIVQALEKSEADLPSVDEASLGIESTDQPDDQAAVILDSDPDNPFLTNSTL